MPAAEDLASCMHQQKVFEQVERLMILGRDYTEHIGPDPIPWPEDDAFLTVAPDSHCRLSSSNGPKLETFGLLDLGRRTMGRSSTGREVHLLVSHRIPGKYLWACARLVGLEEMSSSIQATADKLQSKVVELSKQITPLSMKINKFPVQALTASDAEKAKLEEAIKLDLTQMCNILDSLSKVQGDVEKDSADSKDTVAKIMAQVTDMAGDPEKLSDAPTMQHYLSKIQKAIGTLDSAATSAATYMGIKGMCEKDTQEAATRLFLQTGPVTGLVKRAASSEPLSLCFGNWFDNVEYRACPSPDAPEVTATNSELLEVEDGACPSPAATKVTATNSESLEVEDGACPSPAATEVTARNSESLEAGSDAHLNDLLKRELGVDKNSAPAPPVHPPYKGKHFGKQKLVTVGT
eukprot:s1142_g9.t1